MLVIGSWRNKYSWNREHWLVKEPSNLPSFGLRLDNLIFNFFSKFYSRLFVIISVFPPEHIRKLHYVDVILLHVIISLMHLW